MRSAYIINYIGKGLARSRNIALCVFALAMMLMSGYGPAMAEGARVFDSPQAAFDALIKAAQANDAKEITSILGPEAKELVNTGDAAADNAERAEFVKAYKEKHGVISYTEDDEATAKGAPERVFMEIGKNGWPFPIPMVAQAGGKGWSFDAKQGVEEILSRRVGHNELAAIEVCQAYVDAQYDYYRLNPEKSAIPHFAQKIASSPGKHDGLYWETKSGETPSPLGALVAAAADDGYSPVQQGEERSYYGYRYRVLTSQGTHAAQGAFSYIGNDLMFGGFALLAYPDKYGTTGVMTFMVNQDGVIYEKNLGKDTERLATKVVSFDPDKTWSKVGEP